MSTQEQNTPLTITPGLAMHITEYPGGLEFLKDLQKYYRRMEELELRLDNLVKYNECLDEKRAGDDW